MEATLAFPGSAAVPMPTGSIEAYIQTVNRFPILSADQERALARRFRDGEDLPFDADENEEDAYARVHYLADNDAEPYRVLEAKQSEAVAASGLSRALASLDERSRRIVEARWLREKDTATLHDLAAEFKVSAERIRQIEAKALEKMRKHIGAASPKALTAPALDQTIN